MGMTIASPKLVSPPPVLVLTLNWIMQLTSFLTLAIGVPPEWKNGNLTLIREWWVDRWWSSLCGTVRVARILSKGLRRRNVLIKWSTRAFPNLLGRLIVREIAVMADRTWPSPLRTRTGKCNFPMFIWLTETPCALVLDRALPSLRTEKKDDGRKQNGSSFRHWINLCS